MKKIIAVLISPGMVVLSVLNVVLDVICKAITDYFSDVLDEET